MILNDRLEPHNLCFIRGQNIYIYYLDLDLDQLWLLDHARHLSNLIFHSFILYLYSASDWNQENSRSLKHLADEMSDPLSPMSLPAPKQLKFTPGVVNWSVTESATFLNEARKVPCSILFLWWRWYFFFSVVIVLYSDDTHWGAVN